MTETNTTAGPPRFPAGRYGRRRDPRRWGGGRLRVAVVAFAVLGVVLAGTAVAYSLTQQYGPGRAYDPRVERFYDVTDEHVVVEFSVRVPEGETAVCAVRARDRDGAEVGREEVRVDPPTGDIYARVEHRLATTQRPVTGEVQRCWRAD